MSNLFLKPAVNAEGKPGLVRDPQSRQPLSADGEWKASSSFWQRRIRDKDVVEAKPHPLDHDSDGKPGGSRSAAERLPPALVTEARSLGITVDRRWGVETLEAEIATAKSKQSG